MENLGRFASSERRKDQVLNRSLHVTTLWGLFDLILEAGDIGAVDMGHPQFGDWVRAAQGSFTPPAGFAATSADVITAIFQQEDRPVARHSFTRRDPLAINSVRVGEGPGVTGNTRTHTFTDFGIGFGAIQPFNRGGRNIYIPSENVLRTAELLQIELNRLPAVVTGTNARVWATAFAYNQGIGTLRGVIDAGGTPASLRGAMHPGQEYADGVFGRDPLEVPVPDSWSE